MEPIAVVKKTVLPPSVYNHGLPAPFNVIPTDLVKMIFAQVGASGLKSLMLTSQAFRQDFAVEAFMRQLMKIEPLKTPDLGLNDPYFYIENDQLKYIWHPTKSDRFLAIDQIRPEYKHIEKLPLSLLPISLPANIGCEKPKFVPDNLNFEHWSYEPGKWVIGYRNRNNPADWQVYIWSIKDVPMPKNLMERMKGVLRDVSSQTAAAMQDVSVRMSKMIPDFFKR